MELNFFAVEIQGQSTRHFLSRAGAESEETFGEMEEFEDRHSCLNFYFTTNKREAVKLVEALQAANVEARVAEVAFFNVNRVQIDHC